jgi:hypothetical protein
MASRVTTTEAAAIVAAYKKGASVLEIQRTHRPKRNRETIANVISQLAREEALKSTPATRLTAAQVDAVQRLANVEVRLLDPEALTIEETKRFRRALVAQGKTEPLRPAEIGRLRTEYLSGLDGGPLTSAEIQLLRPLLSMAKHYGAVVCADCTRPFFYHKDVKLALCPACGCSHAVS